MQPIELAHAYAAKGYPVFPCRNAEEIDPETGEIKSEKTPYTSNGLRGATRTKRIIDRLWGDHPEALIGVPTGAPSGFFVLDLDVKPGIANGHEWLAAMEAEHGPLPETTRATTANGGTHIWFKHVDGVRNRGGLGAGVDIRGEGGYVIMPGSCMADGRAYAYTSQSPVADAPQWLLDLLLPSARSHVAEPFSYRAGTNDHYVNSAVDSELGQLAGTAQGGRGYALNASAFSLGQLVGAGALSRQDAEAGLYGAAVANGLVHTDGEREVMAKIRRGMEAGIRQPRDIPDPEHDNTRLVDVNRMIQRAQEKERARNATAARALSVADEPEHCYGVGNDSSEPHPMDEPEAANDNEPDLPINATAFRWKDPATIPRREFAYGTHFIRKYVSVTVSPGGLGKTSLSIAEALAMASGKSLMGTKPPQRLRVWIFNAEDPRDELERRIMAACLHYKLKPEDVEGHLFLDSGREQELVVVREDKRAGVKVQEPIVEAVVQQIERNGIDVMIVDPFVSTHSVNENDNGAIDKVAKLWAQIADYTNCSIDIVHHLRKVADREATVEDARGAVSLIGAARSVRVLNRMSEEQAGQAGVPVQERFGHFSINYGKSNLSPLSNKLDWRKLESVPLGNGRGLNKPQDHAPVVTEWKWPSAEDAVGEVTSDQLAEIITRVRNTDCKLHHQAENWVGREIAYVLGLDIGQKQDVARVKRLVKAWVDDGTFTVVNRRCPIKRENKDFVEVAEAA